MEQVFAPWRIEWVKKDDRPGERDDTCVFCDLPGEDDDVENRIVARNDAGYVLLNNYPYNPGHVMVIPHVHEGDFGALNRDVLAGHARLKQRTIRALQTEYDPDGFNTGMNLGRGAGGSIRDHLHTHVVPRWEGDTNFMPVISDTKVLVEGLADSYDRLHGAFAGQDGTDVGESGAIRIDE